VPSFVLREKNAEILFAMVSTFPLFEHVSPNFSARGKGLSTTAPL